MRRIGIIQYGCGPIGCNVARLAMQRPYLNLVGAVDTAEGKIGKDLGELLGESNKIGVSIAGQLGSVLAMGSADVVLHCTSSGLTSIVGQIEEIAAAGCDIVSTCEELSFPMLKNPETSARIDRIAKDHDVTILATGINPGFLMDAWPLFMSGICQKVETVKVIRIQDASQRRIPFQKKIGAGRTVKEFMDLVDSGRIRHVGIEESIGMIATGLGWSLEEVAERIEPVISEGRVKSDFVTIDAGQVAGVRQVGFGFVGGKVRIILEFLAYVGAKESYDEVHLSGVPDLSARIQGGVNGDIGTAAAVINSIPRVVDAGPGFVSVKDLPMAVCSTRL